MAKQWDQLTDEQREQIEQIIAHPDRAQLQVALAEAERALATAYDLIRRCFLYPPDDHG